MFFKKIKKSCYLFLLAILIMPNSVLAYSDYIIASGENVGIEIKSKGVMIVGTYEIGNENPAITAGLHSGDQIISINDEEVSTVNELATKIENSLDNKIKIGYIRNNITNYTNLKLYKDNNVYKTGLYVKDSITGIGTLTFIDPNTKIFGALGHEIIENNSGFIMPSENGTIFESEVIGIKKSSDGVPGEKNARYYSSQISGKIYENTKQGIFGNYIDSIDNSKLYKVASYNDIKTGKASILTVLEGNTVKEYEINITSLNNNQKYKNIVFEITDEELLSKTGGIVQGMSGSPIIQNEYIVGAVTHVVIDDVTKGYGILIKNMLEEAEN